MYEPSKPQTYLVVYSDRTANVQPVQLHQGKLLDDLKREVRTSLNAKFVQASIFALHPREREDNGGWEYALPGTPMLHVAVVHPDNRIEVLIGAAMQDIAAMPKDLRAPTFDHFATRFAISAKAFTLMPARAAVPEEEDQA